MPQTIVDYYALLGIARNASGQQIERAIRDGIRVWSKRTSRPELEKRQEAERTMARLKEAREILLDPARRQQYDQQLAFAPPPERSLSTAAGAAGGDWLELAQHAMSVKDYATAVRAAHEADPDTHHRSAEVWSIMARANAGLGRLDEAVFEAQRALQLEPSHHEHIYSLAEIYEQRKEWKQAWDCYETLKHHEPASELPWISQGSVYLMAGELDKAVGFFERRYAEGLDRPMAGDYLAMTLSEWADKVPGVRGPGTYTITSQVEIDRMLKLLERASQVTRNPEVISGILHHLIYVREMSRRTFIGERLFSWAGGMYVLSAIVAFLMFFWSGAAGVFFWLLLMAGGAVALFFYCWVPQWKVNAYSYYGGGVPY